MSGLTEEQRRELEYIASKIEDEGISYYTSPPSGDVRHFPELQAVFDIAKKATTVAREAAYALFDEHGIEYERF